MSEMSDLDDANRERACGAVANDGDLRMLGAVDGFAHALIRVRQEIGSRMYHPIDKRHTRKIAEREALLKPLRELEVWLLKSHAECKAAYVKTTEP